MSARASFSTQDDRTALMLAAKSGDFAKVNRLLQVAMNINFQSEVNTVAYQLADCERDKLMFYNLGVKYMERVAQFRW